MSGADTGAIKSAKQDVQFNNICAPSLFYRYTIADSTGIPVATANRIKVPNSPPSVVPALDSGKSQIVTVPLSAYQLYRVRLAAVGYGTVYATPLWTSDVVAGEVGQAAGIRDQQRSICCVRCKPPGTQKGCCACTSAGLSEKPTSVVVSGGAETLTVTFNSVGLLSDHDTFVYKLYRLNPVAGSDPELVDTRIVPRATPDLFTTSANTAGGRQFTIAKAAGYGTLTAPDGG